MTSVYGVPVAVVDVVDVVAVRHGRVAAGVAVLVGVRLGDRGVLRLEREGVGLLEERLGQPLPPSQPDADRVRRDEERQRQQHDRRAGLRVDVRRHRDAAEGREGAEPHRREQRRAVASALQSFDDFRSAQDIHDLLRKNGENVGLSTVYRTLQALADGGELDVLRTEDGEAVYRRCSATHHHHLVCRSCGRTVEVEGPTVERWADGVAGEHGFTDVSHTLEIFGTCPDC